MSANPGIKYAKKHNKPIIMYEMDLWPESLLAGGIKKDSILVSTKEHIEYIKVLPKCKELSIEWLPQYAEDYFKPIKTEKHDDKFHILFAENYSAIKSQLKARKFTFKSATDTEVIANCLERYYLRSDSVLEAIEETIDILEGSFACGILFANEPNRVYFMKKASPLLIGLNHKTSYIGSSPAPIIKLVDKFIDLNDGDYGFIEGNKASIFNKGKKVEPKFTNYDVDSYDSNLYGYDHYMLKEIEEIPSCIRNLVDNYYSDNEFKFNDELIESIKNADEVHLLGCGSSFYAAKVGVKFLRQKGIKAYASIASEYAYDPYNLNKKSFYILISQSGETADLIHCQKLIENAGCKTLAVVNSKGSTLDRKCTFTCLLYCGLEVAVASTKSFVSQVVLLGLLASRIANKKVNDLVDTREILDAIYDVLARKNEIKALAEKYKEHKTAFFIGRGFDYLIALEGTLKLKEIGYVFAECYQAGELKHGPIALIENGTLVVALVGDSSVASNTRNNIEELAARNANIVVFSTKNNSRSGDAFVTKA
ncbi:glutamine--fructose-6-phosphate aminotransferase [isomerizing]-like, partial [Opisthocomus hoazin]|uniref:glutamine--fructose-6-phosphate aminotransferase [isomerizing]-like n=1 Tax=Opisthocomus hoazin TaxID=30419 RepID=UPI003F536D6E